MRFEQLLDRQHENLLGLRSPGNHGDIIAESERVEKF